MQEYIKKTKIKDLLVIELPVFEDNRGFFRELYKTPDLTEAIGREVKFVQGNLSFSKKGVLRGIHCEPMDKVVTVARGTAYCVYVDLRKESETFGQHEIVVLGEPIEGYDAKRASVFIPQGIGNSFLALDDLAYVYSVGKTYQELQEIKKTSTLPSEVNLFDEEIGIKWPKVPGVETIISDRDLNAPKLKDLKL